MTNFLHRSLMLGVTLAAVSITPAQGAAEATIAAEEAETPNVDSWLTSLHTNLTTVVNNIVITLTDARVVAPMRRLDGIKESFAKTVAESSMASSATLELAVVTTAQTLLRVVEQATAEQKTALTPCLSAIQKYVEESINFLTTCLGLSPDNDRITNLQTRSEALTGEAVTG